MRPIIVSLVLAIFMAEAITAMPYVTSSIKLDFSNPNARVRLCGSMFGRVVDLVCEGKQLSWMDYYYSLTSSTPPADGSSSNHQPVQYEFVSGGKCCTETCSEDELKLYCKRPKP